MVPPSSFITQCASFHSHCYAKQSKAKERRPDEGRGPVGICRITFIFLQAKEMDRCTLVAPQILLKGFGSIRKSLDRDLHSVMVSTNLFI